MLPRSEYIAAAERALIEFLGIAIAVPFMLVTGPFYFFRGLYIGTRDGLRIILPARRVFKRRQTQITKCPT